MARGGMNDAAPLIERDVIGENAGHLNRPEGMLKFHPLEIAPLIRGAHASFLDEIDRKSTRLNSSHSQISYAVFCLKKKKIFQPRRYSRTRELRPEFLTAFNHAAMMSMIAINPPGAAPIPEVSTEQPTEELRDHIHG